MTRFRAFVGPPTFRASLAMTLTLSLQATALADAPALRYPDGSATFQANCAVCHGAKGAGTPSLAPPITAYPARYATTEDGRKQLAITVLKPMRAAQARRQPQATASLAPSLE